MAFWKVFNPLNRYTNDNLIMISFGNVGFKYFDKNESANGRVVTETSEDHDADADGESSPRAVGSFDQQAHRSVGNLCARLAGCGRGCCCR